MNLEALKNKLNDLKEGNKSSGGGDSRLLKFADGRNTIRILPAKEEGDEFYHEVMVHNLNLDGKYSPVTCLGDDCPICAVRQELWSRHNAASGGQKGVKTKFGSAAANIKKATPKFLINVVDKRKTLTFKGEETENPDFEKVKVAAVTNLLFTAIISSMLQKDEDTDEYEYGDITDLQNGHDFYVSRQKGENDFYNFNGSQPKPKPSSAGSKAQIAEWLETMYDLTDIIPKQEYDEVKGVALRLAGDLIATSASSQVDTSEEEDEDEVTDENFIESLKN